MPSLRIYRKDRNQKLLLKQLTKLKLGKGTAKLLKPNGELIVLSTEMSCPDCGEVFEELDPRLFSFNSPHGWCLV